MGAFVLGVLVGWLAEWLFYTFWVKAGDDADCSAIKTELELKNRQISSLQSQLASATENTSSSSTAKKTVVATATSSASNTNKSRVVVSKTKSATKNKTTSSKPSPVKKTSSKANPKKATVTKKTTAAKKPTVSKSALSKKTAGGDDFTRLSGIGPSMSATLKTLGIDTFEKLAATDDDILRDMLEASGARMNNNKEAMDSWNEQALVAAKGDFAELKRMQAELKK